MKTRILSNRIVAAVAVSLVGLFATAGPAMATPRTTPLPIIQSFTGSPQSVPHTGGTVTFKASLKYAASCVLSASPANITGLPKHFTCTTSVSESVTIRATSSDNPVQYEFKLVVTNSAGSVTSNPDVAIGEGAAPPPITFTPASVTFAGSTAVSVATAPTTLTIHNNSKTASQYISNWIVQGTDFHDFIVNAPTGGCNPDSPVSPGQSCTLLITFSPVLAGSRTANLEVTDSSWGSNGTTVPVPMAGTGAYGVASLSSATLTYPNTGVDVFSTPITETITNNSTTVSLYIENQVSWTIGGNSPDDFSVVNGSGISCSQTTIDPGKSCTFDVIFQPGGAGTRSAKLSIPDNTQGGQTVIDLTGTGTFSTATFSHVNSSGAVIPWNMQGGIPTYNFGTGGPASISVSVQDTSTVVGLKFDGGSGTSGADPGDFSFSADGCAGPPNVEVPGASCPFTINFNPQTTGERTAELTIFNNTTAGSWNIMLSGGTGTAGGPDHRQPWLGN